MSLFDAFKKKKQEPGLSGGGSMAGKYYDLFPKCQLFKPKYEYPLWDQNWDLYGRTRSSKRQMLKNGSQRKVTRHIFLVRHGQYREDLQHDGESVSMSLSCVDAIFCSFSFLFDSLMFTDTRLYSKEQRVLTHKGREQAKKTGEWLAEIIRKNNISTSTCKVKLLSCSTMKRAKQTANIIYNEIDAMYDKHNGQSFDEDESKKGTSEGEKWVPIRREEPDPMLMEGIPCHFLPTMGQKSTPERVDQITQDFPRMEGAFRKYIGRSDWLEEINESNAFVNMDTDKAPKNCPIHREHEYQIIVSHANMIRFLVCRALQIPPEAWLRLSLFNGSVTYLVIHAGGEVTLRLFGEIGHMGYDLVSSDLYEGFNWDSFEFYQSALVKQKAEEKEKEEEKKKNDDDELT